jgi:hypothetical protein
MSEPVRKRSSPLLTTLFVIVVLVIAYPLSLGPVIWFFQHEYLPLSAAEVAGAFHAPLEMVYNENSTIGRIYESYLDWWDMY